LTLAEQAFTLFVGAIQAVWDQLAPVRAELSAAFDELRTAFAELFEAVKPMVAVLLTGLVVGFRFVAKIMIESITTLVKVSVFMVRAFTNMYNAIAKVLGLEGITLPDLGEKGKSSFGLGQHSADIGTDIAGLKTKLEQQVIEKQSGPSSMEQTADNTKTAASTLERIESQISSLAGRIGGAVTAAANPLGTAASATITALFGP